MAISNGPTRREPPKVKWEQGRMYFAFWVRAIDTPSNGNRKPDGIVGTTRDEVTRSLRRFHALKPVERAGMIASVGGALTRRIAAGFPPARPDPDFDNDVVIATLLRFIDGRKVEELMPVYKLGIALPDPSIESAERFGLPDDLIVELGLQVQRPPRR